MGKKEVIIKEHLLYDDYNIDYDDYRKEYAELFDDESVLTSRDNDSAFYDWVSNCINCDWEDMLANIKYSQYGKTECVILGNLGLWDGRRDILPTRCNNLIEAIKKCVGECPYTIIKLVEGHIEVCGIHHDGRNYFEIYLLNNLALNTEGARLEKECYHKTIRGYLF